MKKQNGETLDTTKRIIENDLLKDLIAISFHIQCEEKYRQNILMPYDQQSLIISLLKILLSYSHIIKGSKYPKMKRDI